MSTNHVTLRIDGMHCGSCAKLVERALKGTAGVAAAAVLLEKQQAIVEYEPERVTLDALKQAVAEQGYTVSGAVR